MQEPLLLARRSKSAESNNESEQSKHEADRQGNMAQCPLQARVVRGVQRSSRSRVYQPAKIGEVKGQPAGHQGKKARQKYTLRHLAQLAGLGDRPIHEHRFAVNKTLIHRAEVAAII
jgi:hypothetical protein